MYDISNTLNIKREYMESAKNKQEKIKGTVVGLPLSIRKEMKKYAVDRDLPLNKAVAELAIKGLEYHKLKRTKVA